MLSLTNPPRSIYNLAAETRRNTILGRSEDKIPINTHGVLGNASLIENASLSRNKILHLNFIILYLCSESCD